MDKSTSKINKDLEFIKNISSKDLALIDTMGLEPQKVPKDSKRGEKHKVNSARNENALAAKLKEYDN